MLNMTTVYHLYEKLTAILKFEFPGEIEITSSYWGFEQKDQKHLIKMFLFLIKIYMFYCKISSIM